MIAHGAIGGDVLIEDSLRLIQEARAQAVERLTLRGERGAAHPIERPEEVHRGGARGGQTLDGGFEVAQHIIERRGAACSSRQHDTEGRRHADGRSTADHEGTNGIGDLFPASALPLLLFRGQAALVEEDEPIRPPADRRDGEIRH